MPPLRLLEWHYSLRLTSAWYLFYKQQLPDLNLTADIQFEVKKSKTETRISENLPTREKGKGSNQIAGL